MSRKIRPIFNFDDSALLEVEYASGKWARVTANHFRSWVGSRRINGIEYKGPVYYEGTNSKYEVSTSDKSRVVSVVELNKRSKTRQLTQLEEVRSYDRDAKYKQVISPNKAYL